MEFNALKHITSNFMTLINNKSPYYNYDNEMQYYIEMLENRLELQSELYERNEG